MLSKRLSWKSLPVLLCAFCLGACDKRPTGETIIPTQPTELSTPEDIRRDRAESLLANLTAGRMEEARSHFDATMKNALPTSGLALSWAQHAGPLGEFKERMPVHTQRAGSYEIVYVPGRFETGVLTTKVVFNSQQQVAGLFFLKGDRSYKPAAYVDPSRFTCREVQVGQAPWLLPGTLCTPRATGLHPGLVLVHGSGPNDRDESMGPNKPFRDLAEGLASRGLAVLRYDKRTKVYPGHPDILTSKEESRDDALIAAHLLAQTPGVDAQRVFVLGHSLGGELLPQILAEAPAELLAGGIVMAGSTRPFGRVVLQQIRYLYEADGAMSAEKQANLARLEEQVARYEADDLEKAAQRGPLPFGMPLSYAKERRASDPLGVASSLRQPLLILQGERDYQVTMEDFAGWQRGLASKKNVTFKTYSTLNHLFMPGKGKSLPAEYMVPSHVDAQVIEDIARWIARQRP